MIRQTAFRGRIGVARFDITPPVGIYSRMWGAAKHETAEGIHRPLTGTAMTFSDLNRSHLLVLISLDLGWWRTAEEEWFLRGHVLQALELQPHQLIIALTHTHAGPSVSASHADRPGGELVEPYLKNMRAAIVKAAETACDSAAPASLAWATGRCQLAGNRIHFSHASGRAVVGYNPGAPADDTLLVGRVTSDSGQVIASIVNYACHPTTLGPSNRLISPDYVGAMREVVEGHTAGAPCLFLQGASGELAPLQQYTDDTRIADQNGRVLGHAALSTLNSMLPHNCDYRFAGVLESGATLGVWQHEPFEPNHHLSATDISVELPVKRSGPTALAVEADDEFATRVLTERLERSHQLQKLIRDESVLTMPAWSWRLGDSYLVGVPAECFSDFQTKLRARRQGQALAIATNANGYFGYVPSLSYYGGESYEVQVSLLAAGCLEKLTEAVERTLTGGHTTSAAGAPKPHFPVHDTPVVSRF